MPSAASLAPGSPRRWLSTANTCRDGPVVPPGWAMLGCRSLAQCPQHWSLTVKVAAPQNCGSQQPRNSATVLATWEGRELRDRFWGRAYPQLFLQKQLYSTNLRCSPSHPAAAGGPAGMACPRPPAASHTPGILPCGSHLKKEKITVLKSLLDGTATDPKSRNYIQRRALCLSRYAGTGP